MNLNVKKLFKEFFVNFGKNFSKFFYRQHPETALRYLPVVSQIKKANLTDSKILEVGSGSLGITPFLNQKIDAVDVNFAGPKSSLVTKIRGSADHLPFGKNTYDVVISVDMIEHLPKEIRAKAIHEMIRVAKKMVVIVVPCGQLSEDQDKTLQERWNKLFDKKNQFLQEHVKFGLPKTDEVLIALDKALRKLTKKAKISSRPNLNLKVRNILMSTWISKSKISYYLYLKGYLLILPLLRLCNFGACYRRVFVIEFVPPVEGRSSSRATNSR